MSKTKRIFIVGHSGAGKGVQWTPCNEHYQGNGKINVTFNKRSDKIIRAKND